MRQLIILLLFCVNLLAGLSSYAQEIATSWEGGKGTQDDPYQIADISQLRKLADDCNKGTSFKGKYLCLIKDITDNAQVLDSEGNLIGDSDNLRLWTAIGKNKECSFQGHFDGRGHCISGIFTGHVWNNVYGFIPINNEKVQGVFHYVENCTIENVIIRDSFFSCFVLFPTETKINNCINFATTSWGLVDGIQTGASNVEIFNCGNYGIAYGAGIANGHNRVCLSLINCYNFGEIRIAYYTAGGLCASAGKIYNCMNAGKVIRAENARSDSGAGICRYLPGNSTRTICLSNCVNYGVIEPFGDGYNGAIVGCLGTKKYSYTAYLKNIYWLETTSPYAIAPSWSEQRYELTGESLKMTEDEMKSEEFLAKLNSNAKALGSQYCGWKMGKQGFPILDIIDEDNSDVRNVPLDYSDSTETYYTLQGCKIENPSNGLFIKVSNTGVEKVFIKH
ncbi:MAG: hypothetical protein HDS26_04105 [Bacteroides sp.]|nr:hypothetical protein [Bacteroides sp.]